MAGTISLLSMEQLLRTPVYISKVVEARCDVRQICTVCSILKLVFIRAGHYVFDDMRHSTGLSACEIEALITFLCTS